MEHNKFDITRLILAIQKTNAHFHLHKENVTGFKSQYYRIKDAIIKEILEHNVEFGINYYLNGSEIDYTGNVYTLVEITNGEATALIHTPVKVCPKILMPVGGTKDLPVYVRKDDVYNKYDVSDDEFEAELGYMYEIFRTMVYNQRRKKMSDVEIVSNLNSTAGKFGIKLHGIASNDCHYKYLTITATTKKTGRILYRVSMEDACKAINEIMTFNYLVFYHYLVDKGIIKPVKL